MNTRTGPNPTTPPDLNLLVADRYRLTEPICGGGMGTVWKGVDERLGRPVAVKILHGSLDGDPLARERFRREAIAASKVSHPAIASVYDYVEEPDRRAIVMELVDGETLAARIARGPLPPAEARSVFADVLSAVQAAHDRGVLHRDIKPSNILLTRDGRVKVTDFGVASMTGDATLTLTGTIMATPQYAAPEQLRGEPSSPATDVYQTGIALYEAMTGRLPFTGETPIAIAMARLSVDPQPPVTDASIDPVVMRAIQRDPADRYATPAAMRSALLGDDPPAVAPVPTMALTPTDESTVALGPIPVAAPTPRPVAPHRLRRIALRSALVALALALAATGLTAAMSGPRTLTLPTLTGRSIEQATAVARDTGLKVAASRAARPGLAAGMVFAQEPKPGARVRTGSVVRLTAADGCCTVPAIATLDGARSTLAAARLTLGEVRYVVTSDAAPGTVLAQRPDAGAIAAPSARVDLIVAKAPEPREERKRKGRGHGDD